MSGDCLSIALRTAHGVGGEAEVGVDVADLADRLAGDLLDVDVGLGGDLAGDDDEAGVDERLAGDAARRVVAQDGVEDAVGDLVGDLVGVTLGHGLGGEEVLVVGVAHGIRREISAVDSLALPDVWRADRADLLRGPPWPPRRPARSRSPVCSPSCSSWVKSRKTSEDDRISRVISDRRFAHCVGARPRCGPPAVTARDPARRSVETTADLAVEDAPIAERACARAARAAWRRRPAASPPRPWSRRQQRQHRARAWPASSTIAASPRERA